ncbi:DNA-binding response regulator [Subtercola boreus]|uniref:DNA-binding response regulator n=1 Tax=Subtercola boreus TaxID=120213 RepID=A0A3E0VH66_9MICO|nr:response regulator transcription factor [Subtercola boreus]RFA08863.1 DNA-binding response regulator [Subtercola boreus]TQL54162.1 LuxR family two component transcriptional regulator [Subtercola boreus]
MRVVIGDDEVLLRAGLRHVLEDDGFEVVAAVGMADELEREVVRLHPDLVITDIRMPPTHTDEGLLAALRIRRSLPDVAVVVLSQYVQRRYATELLDRRTGRVGYLLKQRIADVSTFTADLRRVAAGGTALDPEVVHVLVTRASLTNAAVHDLTPRQREVLSLMAEGRSNARIAAALNLTEKAIVQHTSRIYDAFGLPVDADDHRRVLAVIRYLSEPSVSRPAG